MVYKIWLFPIALVGVIIPLALPFDLSSSSPHLNSPYHPSFRLHLSPFIVVFFSISYFSPPPLLTLHPSDPNPPPQTYLYRMTFYSTKFFFFFGLRESAGILDLAIFRKEALCKVRGKERTVCPRQKE